MNPCRRADHTLLSSRTVIGKAPRSRRLRGLREDCYKSSVLNSHNENYTALPSIGMTLYCADRQFGKEDDTETRAAFCELDGDLTTNFCRVVRMVLVNYRGTLASANVFS